MIRRGALLAVVVGLGVVAGCGDDDGGGGSAPEVDGREFVSTEATGHDLVAGTQIRIAFADGSLSANAGCNTMNGGYAFDGSTMQVEVLATTEMGCDEELMAQDEFLSGLLTSGPTVELTDEDVLTITSGDDVLTLVDRQVAEPDLPLEGTTWQLESIIQNEAVTQVPESVDASLVVSDDGSAAVQTGCNSGSTTVEVGDGTLTFQPMATTMMFCEDPAGSVEQAVTATLAGEVTYEIDSDLLSIRAADGSGLDYRAQ